MKQLREHIKKEIKSLMEANYPAPPEIVRALKDDLKLRPLIRYVSTLKAVNSVPPSYRVFFPKSYWLMNGDETAEAIKAMNRVLTQPIPTSGNAEDEDTKSGDTGEADAEMEPEAGEDEGGEEEA